MRADGIPYKMLVKYFLDVEISLLLCVRVITRQKAVQDRHHAFVHGMLFHNIIGHNVLKITYAATHGPSLAKNVNEWINVSERCFSDGKGARRDFAEVVWQTRVRNNRSATSKHGLHDFSYIVVT